MEFAEDSWFTRFVGVNIGNLAGVPSIIYGLLGWAVFVRIMEPITGGRSVLSGSLTLSLLILPVIMVATREALRAIPDSMRLAGYALGATRWQVIWSHGNNGRAPGSEFEYFVYGVATTEVSFEVATFLNGIIHRAGRNIGFHVNNLFAVSIFVFVACRLFSSLERHAQQALKLDSSC